MGEQKRSSFSSNFGFLMSAIGSAVGLGNIWGFPNKMGANGGFLFLIVYIILAATCGFIVMVGELSIGRKTGTSTLKAYRRISKKFKWVGWLGVVSCFLVEGFYCTLGGYCLKYLVLNVGNLFGAGFGTNGSTGGEVFQKFMESPVEGAVFGLLFMIITMIIVKEGVQGGIEKVSSAGMPLLFVMLLICIVRSLTLPGAVDGLKYMFIPGWAVANDVIESSPSIFQVIATAGGQMFFSMSLGVSIMITLGSYSSKKESITKNAAFIVIGDTVVALLAGLCVIPARFALDPEGALGGPSLLFVTMQNVFSNMGAVGPVFGTIFYLLVVIAAVSSSLVMLEAIVANFADKSLEEGKGEQRSKYVLLVALAESVICVLCSIDGLGSNGLWVPFQSSLGVRGFNDCWLDFFDFFSEGVMMPLGALLMVIMIGWELGADKIKEECEASGHKMKIYSFFRFCCKYITPILLVLVLFGQLKSFLF